jgi:hypothetical protein
MKKTCDEMRKERDRHFAALLLNQGWADTNPYDIYVEVSMCGIGNYRDY